MAYLGLSRRALLDIQQIENDSIEKWGPNVADEYLSSIEDALNRLRDNPGLLRTKPDAPKSLCLYRVRRHFLVCTIVEEAIFVLTVKHGAMDLPTRLAEMEPQLAQEAEMLYHAVTNKKL